MSVRDRYDVGREKELEATKRHRYEQERTQEFTANRAIKLAQAAVRTGEAGPFARALVQTWAAERGW